MDKNETNGSRPRILAMGFSMEEIVLRVGNQRWTAFSWLLELEHAEAVRFDVSAGTSSEMDGEEPCTGTLLRDYHASIVMPSREPHRLSANDLAETLPNFVVGSISAGRDHIQPPADRPDIKVFSCDSGDCNASEVAEFTVAVAVCLLRRLLEASQHAVGRLGANSGFSNTPFRQTESLDRKRWLALGTGRQIQFLIPRLAAGGVRELVIFSPRKSPPNRSDFDKLFSKIPELCCSVTSETDALFHRDVTLVAGAPMTVSMIYGDRPLGLALERADITSLHLPYVQEESPTYIRTADWLNHSLLSNIRADAILVNVARGGIVVESDLVHLLRERKIGGYATDVVSSESSVFRDGTNIPGLSPILDEAMNRIAAAACPGLMITPHIAGTSVQAFERISSTVVDRMLKALQPRRSKGGEI